MNIGINFTWVLMTTLGMLFIAALTYKKSLKTLEDMTSPLILPAGLFGSVWLLLFSVFLSTKNIPAYIFEYLGSFVSCVVGPFLSVVIAKIIVDIKSGARKIISIHTLFGILIIFFTVIFVIFVDNLEGFKAFLSKYISQQTLDDDALSMVGDVLAGFVLFITPFLFYRIVLKK